MAAPCSARPPATASISVRRRAGRAASWTRTTPSKPSGAASGPRSTESCRRAPPATTPRSLATRARACVARRVDRSGRDHRHDGAHRRRPARRPRGRSRSSGLAAERQEGLGPAAPMRSPRPAATRMARVSMATRAGRAAEGSVSATRASARRDRAGGQRAGDGRRRRGRLRPDRPPSQQALPWPGGRRPAGRAGRRGRSRAGRAPRDSRPSTSSSVAPQASRRALRSRSASWSVSTAQPKRRVSR